VDPDWDADPVLDDEAFTVATRYDALDRVTSLVSADGSDTTRTYDEGGRLVTVAVAVKGAADTSFVDHIAYDARGQRLAITYGNGTATTYTYDPFRFWLTRLHTLRGSTALQDLQYTLDAVGNIVEIRDDAQQTEFFANGQITPTRTFTYDALYRLIRATGREKVDQRQTTAFYAEYAGATGAIPDPGDPALRQYTQSYRYDGVGNLLEMKHQQGMGGRVAWRRGYAYEPSNNQLVSTSAPGDDPDDPSIRGCSRALRATESGSQTAPAPWWCSSFTRPGTRKHATRPPRSAPQGAAKIRLGRGRVLRGLRLLHRRRNSVPTGRTSRSRARGTSWPTSAHPRRGRTGPRSRPSSRSPTPTSRPATTSSSRWPR
ncbi:MAG: hypothetical protein ABMA64_24540, partial [Myxococcota bacterium]